ncbi:YjzC family protein [Pontibacillus sp. ALD_SL1]|uniref:YjzC family protein n=1 Tax=Pontibacillus chungwhensis TaxID=265426 RepID=A0ABY8UWC1_9BACI|nr:MULTISPECIES: YjzC family protein [Pontibacillus]MCD5323286.1 YjzC family protein [Pontibacillus sp. HN14]QSS98720.1 YjzC family protein [Pontibacillus sp. ALD_SL1]WIF96669.1 YjzC family protein [Pontibacillus chungwhensis]
MADRYKTGEKVPENGTYEFDGLADTNGNGTPTEDEKHVSLESGETFPPLRSSKEAAYWKKSN